MAKTVFEQTGSAYFRQGDYELPMVELPPQEENYVDIWRQRQLKENHRVLYYNLLTSSKLNEQAGEVDEQEETLFSRLVQEMAKREGVTEALKAADPMAWIRRMNNIRNRVTEIVLDEILTI